MVKHVRHETIHRSQLLEELNLLVGQVPRIESIDVAKGMVRAGLRAKPLEAVALESLADQRHTFFLASLPPSTLPFSSSSYVASYM